MGVTLNTDPEFEALANSLKTIVLNIKEKKTAFADYEPAVSPLFLAIGSFSNVVADLKKVDNQVLLVKTILDVVEGTQLVAMVQRKLAARKQVAHQSHVEGAPLHDLEAEQEVKLPMPQ